MDRSRHRTRREVERFVPTFCPYPDCPDHRLPEGETYRFQRRGTRRIARAPGIVRRFACKACGRTFSSSVFFDCYRRRQAVIPEAVFRGYCEGQSGRQIARTTGLGVKTVQLLGRRMARQALLFHLVQLARLAGRLTDPVVLDALRTFAGSQYEPGDLLVAVAGETLFWLDVAYFGLRRSGTMSARQKRLRTQREQRLGRPPRGEPVRVIMELLRRIARLVPAGQPLRLTSDEETNHAEAVRRLRGQIRIEHATISSRVDRDLPGHPLWPVNHEHRLGRHGSKNHARETLAFNKTAAGLMDRALVYLVWRNNVKGVSERRPALSRVTPAMRLGLTDRPLRAEEIFHRRLFPARVGLPAELADAYAGTLRSRPGERAGTYRYKTPLAA